MDPFQCDRLRQRPLLSNRLTNGLANRLAFCVNPNFQISMSYLHTRNFLVGSPRMVPNDSNQTFNGFKRFLFSLYKSGLGKLQLST